MPTPDTETLAARLRAVERALTDEDAVPNPPDGAALDPPNDIATEKSDPDTAASHPAPEPDPDVRDRLCRLEATVQALHAALDGCDIDLDPSLDSDPDPPGGETTESSGADTLSPDRPPGSVADAPTNGRRHSRELRHDSREPSSTDWPDDLAAE